MHCQTLSYRERRVLELRYGLGGQPEHTREQLAQRFNLTPDRIRQIENPPLTKLQRLPTLSTYDTTYTHPLTGGGLGSDRRVAGGVSVELDETEE